MTATGLISISEPAHFVRRRLHDAGVLAVSLSGDAGAGKTALIEQALRRLVGRLRAAVVIAGAEAGDDGAFRLRRAASRVIPVPSQQLTAPALRDALEKADLGQLDALFIETPARPPGWRSPDLGQDLRVAVFSVASGDVTAASLPRGVADADLVVLNKIDLLPHVSFDRRVFLSDVRRLNLDVPIFEVSAACGHGIDRWIDWLLEHVEAFRRERASSGRPTWLDPPEWFLG